MESEDLTQLLNQYLSEMTRIALEYGATVDKYIGDAIMIFFGDPSTQGVTRDAQLCVEMGIAMQKRVAALHHEWQAAGHTKPFRIRIGIHTGFCTVGNFGTESRMDYTIVGANVNLASRIESAAEPGSITVSEDTWLLLKDRFPFVPTASVTPKGLSDPLQLYRVVLEDEREHVVEFQQEGIRLMVDLKRASVESRRQLLEKLHDLDEPPVA